MFLVNGENRTQIDIADRGFQYGDGLFETIEVINRQAVFLDQHLERLAIGCRRLYIPVPDTGILVSEIKELCKLLPFPGMPAEKAVLKLIITRGTGGRGYKQPDPVQPTRVLSLHPFPDYPHAYQEQGIIVRFCETRLGLNTALAGIKHLNRLEQVLARAEWNDASIQEGIMLDVNDRVIEGTMTNLFYLKNHVLYTAALAECGIAGIMRGIIMMLSQRQGLAVVENHYTKEALLSADEVFVSNSIIGIWPVKQIDSRSFLVGTVTRQIQTWLEQFKRESLSIAS